MLFNSTQFAVFFVIVFTLYLILNHRWQNCMLLVASCLFYGAWSWRFLLLMFVSITTDFFCAKYIHALSDNKIRKKLLILNFVVNLGILGFFKYFSFFANNFQALLSVFGLTVNINLLHVILPVGISFYTFQAMSYSFDVYRKQLIPAKSYFDYALFVTFFPQLVAGPIERATHLLPQILKPRQMTLEKFYEGCYLVSWGLFQKMFIADNLAKIVDPIFSSAPPYNGAHVLLGLYAFAFQIYCDFGGYSNMARGLGKCMGFDIMVNFNLPYFSVNPSEFWKRWHISLSSWLKDYLYVPLGGNRNGIVATYRNLAITMLIGGLWHGAAWTFVIWGVYQGMLLIGHRVLAPFLGKFRNPRSFLLSKIWLAIRVLFFFQLVCIGWLIFRANSMRQVCDMLHGLIFHFESIASMSLWSDFLNMIGVIWILGAVELMQFTMGDLMAVYRRGVLFKAVFYVICFYLLITFGATGGKDFIYFQF